MAVSTENIKLVVHALAEKLDAMLPAAIAGRPIKRYTETDEAEGPAITFKCAIEDRTIILAVFALPTDQLPPHLESYEVERAPKQ